MVRFAINLIEDIGATHNVIKLRGPTPNILGLTPASVKKLHQAGALCGLHQELIKLTNIIVVRIFLGLTPG